MLFPTFIFVLSVGFVSMKNASYQNYRVYSIIVANHQQMEVLLELTAADGIEFWQSPSGIGRRCDVMVAPHRLAEFAELSEKLGLSSRVMVEDVQFLIDTEERATRAFDFGWSSYHTLEAIYEWLDQQLATYPDVLTGLIVGESYENRTIRAVRLSHKEGNPIIFIEANIHAREWITSATATWILNELLTSVDPAVIDLAQNIDWVIIPVLNVDGFAYSHKKDRLWRKTRQPHSIFCYGADSNRNMNFHWMSVGASSNVCAETYAGPKALSEPENQALAQFVESFSGNIKAYISFHSYSQLFLFPWGHTAEHIDDYDLFMAVGKKTKEAIAARYGTQYTLGPSSTTIYYNSGSTHDWAYGVQHIKLAYTFEFRDTGRHGFLLPANQIVPNSEEILDGLIAFVTESRAQNVI